MSSTHLHSLVRTFVYIFIFFRVNGSEVLTRKLWVRVIKASWNFNTKANQPLRQAQQPAAWFVLVPGVTGGQGARPWDVAHNILACKWGWDTAPPYGIPISSTAESLSSRKTQLARSKRSQKDSERCVVMQVSLTFLTWASSVLHSIVKSTAFPLLKLGAKIICMDPHNHEEEMVIGSAHKILEWFGLKGIF